MNARRYALLLATVTFCAASTIAQEQDFSKVEIKVTKVSGSVYMLEGAGGNIGVSVGVDGIVIVDDQFAPLADKIRAALKGITDKPVRFVINTHHHFDHTGGNEHFRRTHRSSHTTTCANGWKTVGLAVPGVNSSSTHRLRLRLHCQSSRSRTTSRCT